MHHVNQISAKHMSHLLKRKQVNNAFLGFVRMVKEENVAEKYKGKSDLGAVHLWREDLPVEIKAVLDDYEDVFPKDLPSGLPPICKGHEFKIELEDDAPPSAPATLQVESTRAGRGQEADRVYAPAWIHQTIRLSLWRPSLIRTEEGWRTMLLH